MTQRATSRRTPSNKNEIRKNRRKNENPINKKELNFQENFNEHEGDKEKHETE